MEKLKYYASIIWLVVALICIFSGMDVITNWCLRSFYGWDI